MTTVSAWHEYIDFCYGQDLALVGGEIKPPASKGMSQNKKMEIREGTEENRLHVGTLKNSDESSKISGQSLICHARLSRSVSDSTINCSINFRWREF